VLNTFDAPMSDHPMIDLSEFVQMDIPDDPADLDDYVVKIYTNLDEE
jgi:hypothetical protein